MIVLRKVAQLRTTSAALDRLWHIINERREGSSSVKVKADDLSALLIDFQALCRDILEDPELLGKDRRG